MYYISFLLAMKCTFVRPKMSQNRPQLQGASAMENGKTLPEKKRGNKKRCEKRKGKEKRGTGGLSPTV